MLNKLLYSSFFFAVLCPCRCYSQTKPYKHIGCFKDTSTRAVPDYLGHIRTNDVQQCADKASAGDYPIFGLQVGYECRGGYGKTYNMYGTATNCKYGGGGGWANDVYQFTDEILWPKGTFSLLKPSSGCPSDLIDNGWLLQDTVDNVLNVRSPVLNIDGYVARGYVVRSFCTKTTRTSSAWPKGQYCIYKEGDRNPIKMKSGWVRMENSNNQNKGNKKMKYNKGIIKYNGYYYIDFNFYCQTTGVKSVPIDLPISQPFYLLPYGSPECQQVKWMVATKEWIRYGTRNYQTQTSWRTGKTPYIEAGKNTNPGLKMFYCLYTSCNQTLNNTQGSFNSPRYPGKYPDGQLCSWRILVPVNHTVLVHFIQFHLSDDSRNGTDVLELHRLENKSFVSSEVYQGYNEPFKVSSTSDLLFVFRSDKVNSSQGFHAQYEVFVPEPVATTGRPSTSTSPSTIQEPTRSPHNPTTGFESANETKNEALKDDSKGTGTILLIVIPLVCFILIAVVAVDIYIRCRSKPRKTKSNGNSRNGGDHLGAADNLTYESPAVMRMKNIKSTTTDDKEQQDTDNSYERLSHIAPRREVPEQYDELNRSSQPSSTNNMSLPENDPEIFYHVLEGTDQSVDDETMYQVIDKDPCEDDLYERNVLYDNVA